MISKKEKHHDRMATPFVSLNCTLDCQLQPRAECVNSRSDQNCLEVFSCRFAYANWCPVCEVRRGPRCRRRRSKSEGLEGEPLRERNRLYDANYEAQPWRRKIVREYDQRSRAYHHGHQSNNGEIIYEAAMDEDNPKYPGGVINVAQSLLLPRRSDVTGHYIQDTDYSDMLPTETTKVHPSHQAKVAGLSSQVFDSPGAWSPHSSVRDQYVQEVQALRSKLRALRGGWEGKRLRQRSESEPGASNGAGGGPKRARDISPNFLDPGIYSSISSGHRDAKLSTLMHTDKSLKLPGGVAGDDGSLSSDSDFPDSGACCSSCGSGDGDGDSKGEPGEDSEEDNQSVLSSLTTISSDSNTPSMVGETLGSISLNDTTPSRAKMSSSIRPSLFSNVPPYVNFSMHDSKGESLPSEIQRHLKWKLSTITPLVVRRTLTNSNFRLVRKSNDWCGTWGKHMKSLCFKTLKDFQKINHFPGTFQIGRKDRLWKNLYRLMTKFGKKEFGFIPRTYVLPQDGKLLRQAWEKSCGKEKWIIKPPASARGTGIKVVHRWTQIPKKRPLVVQRYISQPYLINGSKFDLRLYVLVTSIHPLRVYLYGDGLVRFASVKYSGDNASLGDRYMHLTNYSINKLSSGYTQNEDATACHGHKWTVQSLWRHLEQNGVDVDGLWRSLQDLAVKTIVSGEGSIQQLTRAHLTSRYCSYELFGLDVLLDEHLRPWLLEVNISPSLHSASPLDLAVKGPLVRDLLNLAGFQIPARLSAAQQDEARQLLGFTGPLCHDKRLYTTALSKKERLKHAHFQTVVDRHEYLEDILWDLTPDDVRHLIQSEDELTQAGRFSRIFPTPHTHSYHEFFDAPRYYNKLFDAWETKYHQSREKGIQLLESLCLQKVHFTIPPPAGITKSSASRPDTPTEDSPEEQRPASTERRVFSLTAMTLHRATRPRNGALHRATFLVRRAKSAITSPGRVTVPSPEQQPS